MTELETRAEATSAPAASLWRAWWSLVSFSFQRQARARQMVVIALLLLAFMTLVVAVNTARDRWNTKHWRSPRRIGPSFELIHQEARHALALPADAGSMALSAMFVSSTQAALDQSGFMVFSNWVVYSIFVSFLLPIWSLSFATESLGGERESRTLTWLLSRPMPRGLIYLARFSAVLPWVLGLNLFGFLVICWAGGEPGWLAFRLYWPAVLWSSLAFAALFHAMGAMFRRPAVVAIVYSFFLETFLGNLPGYMKRVSIGFYARCLMFDEARSVGVEPQPGSVFLPVDSVTAWWTLMGLTVAFLLLGMAWFSRAEYAEVA
ncbi:MAG: ABC transporter permease [Gemmataceae bacterium]